MESQICGILCGMKNRLGYRKHTAQSRFTAKVALPGGQDRLRQMILYVSRRCVDAERMGLVKLNKILWKADFDSYAERQVPVTGCAYQRLALGPAPREMLPLLRELLRIGAISYIETNFGDGIVEKRPIPQIEPNLLLFSRDDLSFVDRAISYYWNKTGEETSDDSHGIAWKTRPNKSTMFYELAYISDDEISEEEKREILKELEQFSQ